MPTKQAGDSKRSDAHSAALRLLAYRARSEAELRQRLLRRFPSDDVERAIQSLKAQGYLDDADFARRWRESREASHPRSARRIRQELSQHGVAPDEIERALEGFDDEGNAMRAARKYVPSLRGLDYPTFARRLGTYLQRRGFSSSLIWRIVRQMWSEQVKHSRQ